MPRLCLKLSTIVCLGLILCVQAVQTAEARVTVEDRNLVSKTRASRTVYVYSYTLTIQNVGTTLSDVKVYVSCDNPGTTLIDDVVEFGDIAENSTITSTDTFSFGQDRRQPFDPDCLIYEVGFETALIISGTATDTALSNALITGTITHPDSGRPIIDSGRPIIEEFSTVADADGNYTLEMDAVTEDDFITLEAEGVGEQEGAVLTSSLGSVGTLQEQGTSGSIVVDSSDNGATNITHITTALDQLVKNLNNGVLPTTDGQLAALQARVNGGELLQMASLIKTIIDNANVPLPPGFNTTTELIADPVAFAATLQEVQTMFPNEYQTANEQTAAQLKIGYTPAEVPGELFTLIRDESPLTLEALVFSFDDSNGGTVVMRDGDSDITWIVNSDEEIEVDLLNPPITESFVFRNPPGEQVRAETFVDSIRIVRLANGLKTDQVLILKRTVTTFPDVSPPIPDEVIQDVAGSDNVYLAFGSEGVQPIDPLDIAGQEIFGYYYHQDNNAVGFGFPTFNSDLGADALTFNTDSTGSTQRRGFGFNWSVDPDGIVELDFDNGDGNRLVQYSSDGEIKQVLVIGSMSNGVSKVIAGEALESDGITDFTEPNLVNRRYRSVFATLGTGFAAFDFLFLTGGDGCRISDVDGMSAFFRPILWESIGGIMDLITFIPDPLTGNPQLTFQRRTWEGIRMDPGDFGDRYWVLEHLQINNNGITSFPTWALDNVTFEDGGIATGIIEYDFATSSVVSWDITVSGGDTGTFAPFTYNDGSSTASVFATQTFAEDTILFTQNGTSRQLRITPTTSLDGTQGLVPVELGGFGIGGAEECFNCAPFRPITGGSFVAAIPPATTPGRINAYEFIEDLTGQPDPCDP